MEEETLQSSGGALHAGCQLPLGRGAYMEEETPQSSGGALHAG